MNWFKWDSIEDFNAWENQIQLELGLPKLSVDAEGNTIPNSVINENYTLPIIVADNDIRASVQNEYATGLQPSTNPDKNNYEANSL